MPLVDVKGVRIYYELHGEAGEPLVLVHGYTGDLVDWRYVIPEFARTHRVLAMEHRGHGRSDAPADRDAYSILQLADDVEAVIEAAGFARYHLVGHSMGGAVVQEIALRSPERLLSLTLHDTAYRFAFRGNEAVRGYLAERMRLAEEEGMAAVADMASPLPPSPLLDEERRAYERERLSRMSPDGFIGAWRGLQGWPGSRDRLAQIRVPTLVICGEKDAALVEPAKVLAAEIPNATLAIIPDAAHSPQYERPELYNAALRAHLSRVAQAAARA